jgi:hypothetical protein
MPEVDNNPANLFEQGLPIVTLHNRLVTLTQRKIKLGQLLMVFDRLRCVHRLTPLYTLMNDIPKVACSIRVS